MLDQTIEDVRELSRELFPWQIEKLGLTKALENLVEMISEKTDIFFSSDIESVDTYFKPNQSIQIYRIVQECISNIIKHSEADAAKVSLAQTGNKFQLSIQDNGVGVKDISKFLEGSLNSLGLTTLQERIKSLEGRMTVQKNMPKGLRLNFEIPMI